ncbi:hypothetical protein GCM10009552_29070 [Rothia nasimurium]|uniref:Chemotaxis protein n=1 Tax=Luteibacter anthropi TaxID=564369 RepID=A0A7X5UAS9_9GAMM|nr:hypothetical protein [Luteibacter anthropi]NII06902.1 hypothetical protein [Luteibacter anthropi]
MMALLREYLASLRERDELDAIFPDLLAEVGYRVLTRPQRGTTQKGVDIAAVGIDEGDGRQKVFLFSLKRGDLSRQEWDGTPQAVRSSLNQMMTYRRNRIPPRLSRLPVVGCLVVGGQMQETVLDDWNAFIRDAEPFGIEFVCWNGDDLARLLSKGYLKEEVMPQTMRREIQKAVAMADFPDVSARHFGKLCRSLVADHTDSDIKKRITAIRQVALAASIVHAWCRDIGNLEAAWRTSERAVLCAWELARTALPAKPRQRERVLTAVNRAIVLHRQVAAEYVLDRIAPNAGIQHGLTMQVHSAEYADINLALFTALGRIAMTGLWMCHSPGPNPHEGETERTALTALECVAIALRMIGNNPILLLPCTDRQATDIALFMQLCVYSGAFAHESLGEGVRGWLASMTERLGFTFARRTLFPRVGSSYENLVDRQMPMSDEEFKTQTGASTLIPLLAIWLHVLALGNEYRFLEALVESRIPHCTLQLWIPSEDSENKIYGDDAYHGLAVSDVDLKPDGDRLIARVSRACRHDPSLHSLSAVTAGLWPIVLHGIRHQGLPVPPPFWLGQASNEDASEQPGT